MEIQREHFRTTESQKRLGNGRKEPLTTPNQSARYKQLTQVTQLTQAGENLAPKRRRLNLVSPTEKYLFPLALNEHPLLAALGNSQYLRGNGTMLYVDVNQARKRPRHGTVVMWYYSVLPGSAVDGR